MVTQLKKFATWRFDHPWKAMTLFIPLGLGISALILKDGGMSAGRFAVLFGLGIFAWTLIEYGLHRFVFHWTEAKEPWKTLASGLHSAHHESTSTADLIIAPPVVSLTFGCLYYLLFSLLVWSFRDGAAVEVGMFAGYLYYEWVHFMSHCFHPSTPWTKYLRKYHLQHHFRDDDRQYGVTSPLWDLVFGTYSGGSLRARIPLPKGL